MTQTFEFSGDVSVGASSSEDAIAIGRLDATFTLPIGHVNGRALTFELGTFAYLQRGRRPHETYAAVVLDDRWRLGGVRPAYDAILPSVFSLAAPSLANTRAEYARAFTTIEALRFNSVPLGVSYAGPVGPVGNLTWAASVHSADKGDFRAASAALIWQEPPLQLAAALEAVWDPRSRFAGFNAKAGARWTGARLEAGLAYLHPDANRRPDALAFDIHYAISRRLTLSAFGEVTKARQDGAFGVAAKYRIDSRSDVIFSATAARDDALHLTYTRHY